MRDTRKESQEGLNLQNMHIKGRQKKKWGNKQTRVNADGLVSLEELEKGELRRAKDEFAEKQSGKSSNKKRKSIFDKQNSARSSNPQESSTLANSPMEADEASPMILQEKPSSLKRIKKSVSRNLEPSPYSATRSVAMNSIEHFPPSMFEYTRGIDGAIAQDIMGLQSSNTIQLY